MSELFSDRQTKHVIDSASYALPPEMPGAWQGIGSGIYQGIAGIGSAAYGSSLELAQPVLQGADIFSPEETELHKEKARQWVKDTEIDPMTTGFVGNLMGSFARIGGEAILGGVAGTFAGPLGMQAGAVSLPGALEGYRESVLLQDRGVDQATADLTGTVKAATTMAAVAAPIAFKGLSIWWNAGAGAAVSGYTGMADRFATQSILERDYPEMAQHYKWNESVATATDLLLGGLLGGVGSKFINKIDSQTMDAARVSDTALAEESLPAIHRTPQSLNDYLDGVREATRQLLEGKDPSEITLSPGARNLDLMENPFHDEHAADIVNQVEERTSEIRREMEDSAKVIDELERQKSAIEDLVRPETIGAEAKAAELRAPETVDQFNSQHVEEIERRSPDMVVSIKDDAGNVKDYTIAELREQMRIETEEAVKMGRLYKVAAACSISFGEIA